MPVVAIGALDDCRTRGSDSHRSHRKRRSCYPKSEIVKQLSAITALTQVLFGAMLTILGLAGMPADLTVAIKILSVGLVQAIIATPGVVAWKHNVDRLWLLYGTLQLTIGVAEICWMVEAILLKNIVSAVVLAFLAVIQIWSTVVTVFRLRIDGCSHLSRIARGETQKSSSGTKTFIVAPRQYESYSHSPGLRSPHRKSSVSKSSKAGSKASGSMRQQSSASGKKSSRHEQITLKRYQRASARLNKLVNKKANKNQSSMRESEASVADRMKSVPEAKTPPLSTSEYDSSKKYDDVNSLSDPDPEESSKHPSSQAQLGTRRCIYVPRSRGVIALEVHTPPSSDSGASPVPSHQPEAPPLSIQADPVLPVAPKTAPPPAPAPSPKPSPRKKPSSSAIGSLIVTTPPHEPPSSSVKKTP